MESAIALILKSTMVVCQNWLYNINEHFSAMADFSIAKFDANDGPGFKPAF